jgi:thiol-disulfide isomerase/thioredoxin
MNKILILTAFLLFFVSKLTFSQYDFDLNDVNGNSVKLSEQLKKGPVFIQFWALWCIPCKEEMRVLNELYGKYKDSGFVYLMVNQDSPKSSSKVRAYIESKGYPSALCLMDGDLAVFEKFGGQNLPFSVFLDKSGSIIKTYTGYIQGDESKLEEDIKSAVKSGKN